jgi:hypothetical protein
MSVPAKNPIGQQTVLIAATQSVRPTLIGPTSLVGKFAGRNDTLIARPNAANNVPVRRGRWGGGSKCGFSGVRQSMHVG